MCSHNTLIFIGYQECPDGSLLPLYNCKDCNTTLAVRSHKGHIRTTRHKSKSLETVK